MRASAYFALITTVLLSGPKSFSNVVENGYVGTVTFNISNTFKLIYPKSLQAEPVPLPAYRGFLFEGKWHNNPISIWTSRKSPETIANSFSVNRFWKENLAVVEQMGEKSKDLGCKLIQKYIYRCDRQAEAANGKYLAELVIWNAKSDLIVIRTTSKVSMNEAKALLAVIQFQMIGRLPASSGGRR